jgi:hypothetical protein
MKQMAGDRHKMAECRRNEDRWLSVERIAVLLKEVTV